jgi:hypothetical protein
MKRFVSQRAVASAIARPMQWAGFIKQRASWARFGSMRGRVAQARVFGTLTLALSLLLLTGCGMIGTPGSLTVAGQAEQRVKLTGSFDRAFYGHDSKDNLTIILLDGPVAAPRQAAVIRMFWMPQAGATPISADATNANVHYCIFAGDNKPREVGVYTGAGFLYPKTQPGQKNFEAALWQASLQLSDRSDRFRDLLGQSILKGEVTAQRSETRVSELLHQLNVEVNKSLGYPRMVREDRLPSLRQALSLRTSRAWK